MAKKPVVTLFFLLLISLGCSLPGLSGDGISLFASPTPSQTPTLTPSPTPTPTPTPLPVVRVKQAEMFLFEGNFERALSEFQIAHDYATEDETRAGALLGIGRSYLLNRQYDQALSYIDQVINDYSDTGAMPLAQFFRGLILMDRQDYAQAAQAFGQYLNFRPGLIDAYVQELRGDALSGAGDHTGAIAAYEAAIQAPKLSASTDLEIKIGKEYAAMGDHVGAIRKFMQIYEASTNDYVKAQANFLAGKSYLAMGIPEQAHARFQDSVNNFPRAYDSYSGLVVLIESGIPVDELNRGLVDYFAGQYGVAVDALSRYLQTNPDHNGTAHFYKGLSHRQMGDFENAINEWNALITDHPNDRFYSAAFDEKAYTQWVYLNQYAQAAQTLIEFVNQNPAAPEAPEFLYEAARTYERGNLLNEAAAAWERLINDYPSAELSYRGLFLAGITHYRLGNFQQAQVVFQRALVLAIQPADQAAAHFWIGKTQAAANDPASAQASWQQASVIDPGTFYSERARDKLAGIDPFKTSGIYNLNYNLEEERRTAEIWLRATFNIPPETDLNNLAELEQDPRLRRGNAFWEVGQYSRAAAEFEALRQDLQLDAVNSFRLLDHLLDLGFYQSAIFTSRQILDLANLDDNGTFTAPAYYNHIRFGLYFKENILQAAQQENLDPLFLFSIIRQESMFQGYALSTAGARGLMQIIPATGREMAAQLGWPQNYTDQDLYLPYVSIRLGSHYLARQRDLFNGDPFATLAAYNGGPGNAGVWHSLAASDPDLFVEVVRASETRKYIMQIFEFLHIYRRLYEVQ
ncbi:MAG: tetratricopeptide repeat protein [Anaerolineae bacterium]|nr:tetratricopeptide repeat protein [Anaerolineae bacterium]